MQDSFEILFKKLELNNKQGLFKISNIAEWEHLFPYRTIRALKTIEPYAIYAIKNNSENEEGSNFFPIYLFIDNSNKIDLNSLLAKIWNFQAPVVIVDDGNQWYWYSGEYLNEEKTLNELIEPIIKENIDKSSIIDNFSFWNIHSGRLWELYKNEFKEVSTNSHKIKLQTYLLQNIEEAIKLLTTGDTKIQHDDNRQIANNLIGRLIFIRYLIDRKVNLNFEFINTNNQRKDFEAIIPQKDKLYSLFEFLKSPNKFNGDLFPFYGDKIDTERSLINEEHLKILHKLFLGEIIKENNGQYSLASLFDIYDFNIIPVELISNIYERFMGKENQKKEAAFYTPPFLVDYVLKHTIEQHLKENINCKVLDPSCGSGIFLVETLRKLIESNIKSGHFKRYNELKFDANKTGKLLKVLIDENDRNLKQIVEENIFGVDKDINAVTIAIFSIYITILDYKEPKEIENFKLPELINKNFFINNFFDNELNTLLKDKKFDFIIGNPPWGNVKDDILLQNFIKKNEDKIISNQIAQSFILRIQDFSSKNTKCALILPSLLLYNNATKAVNLRNYIVDNYKINRVLELSLVRKYVFEGAKAPACVLFFQIKKNEDHSKNIVHYISVKPNRFFNLFKIIVIEKLDYKKIYQGIFRKNIEGKNFAWKTLLFGNILDYKLLDRLYEDNPTNLNEFVNDNKKNFGTGYVFSEKNAGMDADFLFDKPLVDEKSILPFYTINNGFELFKEKYPEISKVKNVGYKEIYLKPHLLIRQGIYKRVTSTLLDFDAVFPKAIFGIHSEDKSKLYFIGSLLSSSLVSFLLLNISPRWGVERNVIDKLNIKTLPIPKIGKTKLFEIYLKYERLIENLKSEYEKIYQDTLNEQEKIFADKYNTEKLKQNVRSKTAAKIIKDNKFEDYFDKIIYELYDIDSEEIAVIEYALNVSIPLFRQKENTLTKDNPNRKLIKEDIENYINVFFEKNKSFLEWKGIFMSADVYFDKRNYVIVNFKFEENEPDKLISYSNEKEKQDKFTFLASLFSLPENISNNLFMQKDLKGIEKTSFYIIKPDEFKNWHPAVAYLDYYEFKDAFIRAGRDNKLTEI